MIRSHTACCGRSEVLKWKKRDVVVGLPRVAQVQTRRVVELHGPAEGSTRRARGFPLHADHDQGKALCSPFLEQRFYI
ncbi:MAG: hypothetical protein WCI05_09975, partial [Myxococcales bacterium]